MTEQRQKARAAEKAAPRGLLTVADVTSYLGFDRDGHRRPDLVTRRLLEVGELPGFKVARRWRVRLADLEKYVEHKLAAQATEGIR